MKNEDDIAYTDDTLFVKRLFSERDDAYIASTQLIVDVIGPTVLEALYEVFNVPVDDVKWLDFSQTDNLLIVVCSIAFNPQEGIPEFIEDTIETNSIPNVNEVIEQNVRVGIPYELVMKDPEEIVDFIDALVDSHMNGGPSLIQTTNNLDGADFITSSTILEDRDASLTDAQRQSLLLFTHTTQGKLH